MPAAPVRALEAPDVEARAGEAALHLAAAVLLIQVAKSDHQLESPELSRIADSDRGDQLTEAFDAMDAIYVADGHHRTAAAALVGSQRLSLHRPFLRQPPGRPHAGFQQPTLCDARQPRHAFPRARAANRNPRDDLRAVVPLRHGLEHGRCPDQPARRPQREPPRFVS